ncbi:MAG TPA: class I SAM-dependent methyltransferase [Stellaceae bacterium]|nr:class I SAM-dependent methyltransferase [Stellaceae bacterium]
MTDHIPIDPARFRSAAPHYLQGRPPYSALLIQRVVALCALGRRDRVLDLGCGPGQLAVALAPFVGEVVAMDPEPAMLQAAATEAARLNLPLRLVAGGSEDLASAPGRFRVVTMGRSFHWMDRPRTLARLDGLIEAEGAVVLFRDRHPALPENAWSDAYRELLRRYAAEEQAGLPHRGPHWLPHEAVLLASPFSQLERYGVIERRATPVATFVERAFSMSSTAPARIGNRAAELATEVERLMAAHAVDGLVAEVVETEALMAHRPAADGTG